MDKRIVFKNIPHSSVMEDYANQQLVKIEDFLSNSRMMDHGTIDGQVDDALVHLNLTIEPSKLSDHAKLSQNNRILLKIKGPGYDFVSEYEGPEPYDVLDRVIDVMYRQLIEYKEKEVDMRKSRGRHEEFKKQR